MDGMMRRAAWGTVLGVAVLGSLAACSSAGGSIEEIITGRMPIDQEIQTVSGTLVDEDGCASLFLNDEEIYPIIWPLGFEIYEDGSAVGDVNGQVVLGQALSGRGFYFEREAFDSLVDVPEIHGLDRCSPGADTLIVFTQVEDFDTAE